MVLRQQTTLWTISVHSVGCRDSCNDLLTAIPHEILGSHMVLLEI